MTEPAQAPATTRRLVLVGGGLAHLHVLHAWRRRPPPPGVELVLVTPDVDQYYSGMVPGFLRGEYEASALRIDLAALARHAGARLVLGAATRILRSERIVEVGTERLTFDLCSVDVGSGSASERVPGGIAHAVSLRPMRNAIELRARLDAFVATARPVDVVVVGGGAGGVEVAFALRRRMNGAGANGTVTLVESRPRIMDDASAGVQAVVDERLRAQQVGVVLGGAVSAVDDDCVRLASGATLPASVVVWTAGSAPPALLSAGDLPLDDAGYLLVDRKLQVVGGAGVWAAGDCVTLQGARALPRSGVYAVRQGPVLLANLRAALGAGRTRRYRPRRRALTIIDTSDGRAVARWGAMHWVGRWAMALKRRIDFGFVRKFRRAGDESTAPAS